MKIAAIQLDAIFADVTTNLIQTETIIRQAVSAGAELILLPEFFTSAIGFSGKMLDIPAQNAKTHEALAEWAGKYNITVGGSYISFDGNNAYNLFELVFPNGETFAHKKDIPTQFENCYYTNGDTNHILVTPIGNIGISLCWEMIRYDTVRRMAGKADIVLAGSCWWDLPEDAGPEREPLRRYNQNLALETPVTFAKLLGIPLIHATHCGKVTASNFPKSDKIQTRQLVGGTQIIGPDGNILQRKGFQEGAGFVISDVPLKNTSCRKIREYPQQYWIPDLPESYIRAWEAINPEAKLYYSNTALPYYKGHYK